MSLNKNLQRAKREKNDEFYTQLPDIEKELRHYTRHFRGKVVYCNCDDPRVSKFFHYFSYNFERLGLKRLVTACYRNRDRDLLSRHDSERAIWLEYAGNAKGGRVPDIGGYRSPRVRTGRGFLQRGMHRASGAGGHRGDQPAVFAFPRIRRPTDAVRRAGALCA